MWHLLSEKERFYVLSLVRNKRMDSDVNDIYHQLSQEEKRFIMKRKGGYHE
jgi:hypothetical protein